MTEVRFDDTHKQDRVILPRLKKLPPNPHIAGHIRLAPSSEASSVNSSQVSRFETKADKSLRYDLLTADQRCFLTGSASASLRACHIIITVRKDGPRKIKVVSVDRCFIHPLSEWLCILGTTSDCARIQRCKLVLARSLVRSKQHSKRNPSSVLNFPSPL
jgi:hypothetical protein